MTMTDYLCHRVARPSELGATCFRLGSPSHLLSREEEC
ncbi:hypothetical protein AH4AK4_1632 [Aeromonas hydrophila 4AK4]|nr:hypothetical protein AH4AK4_1632 [Aeromonas hydrophila 4AK4]